MVFRKSGPGLVGRAAKTAARTALITATATTVANKMSRPKQDAGSIDPAASASAGSSRPAGLSDEAIARLEKLAEMHKAGILSDAEFAEQKARLLA
ncbi:SHOCT domain-containing protein [Mesorhizobium microcysteis]|uniref:SHOCT domain-containing protein n=1 Tax=Neoaquamicrobium microcysteis TaxID=2682781 RepID=A0A5D4GP62_9HYPH|nr:SHOCT domain-containing protein [Mesorhizobium microcysteis]TYR29549.1 SHOCT domain-containing protein [Mesorhizobium microcysteis]